MKSVFYFSPKMDVIQRSNARKFNRRHTVCTIDGKEYNEHSTLEDDEEVKPYNGCGDNILVAIVENVPIKVYNGDIVSCDTNDLTLGGRIKYC